MPKRTLCCLPVSVRPFVTFVYCIQTAEYVVKYLLIPSGVTEFQRKPTERSGGVKIRELE